MCNGLGLTILFLFASLFLTSAALSGFTLLPVTWNEANFAIAGKKCINLLSHFNRKERPTSIASHKLDFFYLFFLLSAQPHLFFLFHTIQFIHSIEILTFFQFNTSGLDTSCYLPFCLLSMTFINRSCPFFTNCCLQSGSHLKSESLINISPSNSSFYNPAVKQG